MANAPPEGWIYCAGCGNPCRAPAQPGQYACPRCGRRLGGALRARLGAGAGRAAARTSAGWRALFLLSLAALGLLITLGGTMGRVARAEGKSLVAEGLPEDVFAIDADALYTRTFRQIHRRPRSGGAGLALAGARGGMTSVVLADGWLYYVTRPWRVFDLVYEIRRVPARGGPEERVARLDQVAFFPPILAVQHGRLYALANWRGTDETWESRLLRWDQGKRREEVLLARGLLRPVVEYLIDREDAGRVLWLRPDELRPEGERPGALYEASFRDRSVQRLLEIPHPRALGRDGETLCWLNEVYLRPRFSDRDQTPQFRGYSPQMVTPADEVQLQVLSPGARQPRSYTLPALPLALRGTVHNGNYYWMAAEEASGAREFRIAVYRLSLSAGQVSVVSRVSGNPQGPAAWFLTDPSGALYLYERYLYENWFDWSPQGLSARQLGRLWRLETE